jgi:hypothetical protein
MACTSSLTAALCRERRSLFEKFCVLVADALVQFLTRRFHQQARLSIAPPLTPLPC